MKTLPILNMIPQFNLNLRLAHKDTLKEIYHRLAKMIMNGDRIKRSQYMKNASGIIGRAGRDVGYSNQNRAAYFKSIKPKQKEMYFFGDESGPISEEAYGDIEPFKRKEIKTRDVSGEELEFIAGAGRDVGYSSIIEPKEKIYCYGESSIERG